MDEFIELLNNMFLESEEAGKKIIDSFNGDMNSDLQYMCKLFSERQFYQLQSLILLKNRDDVILIARSMFEGALYLAYSVKHREMSRRWRLFSVVIDMQRFEKSNEKIPDEVKKQIEILKPEADRLFKNSKGEYERCWYGKKSIRQIARDTDEQFVLLYDKYYSPMSEYHHWGTAAFGKRYKLNSNKIIETKSDEVKLEQANALCMALSSIFSTLKIASKILGNNKCEKIIELEQKLRNLDGTTTREINITSKSR